VLERAPEANFEKYDTKSIVLVPKAVARVAWFSNLFVEEI